MWRQLVWEAFRNGKSVKIAIDWSNIVGITASLMPNEPEILEIEVTLLSFQISLNSLKHKNS